MNDLNQCTFTGRLGADPEIRRTSNGKPVASLRLAVGESWKDKSSGERKEKTEWVSVVIWNEGLCRVAEGYLKKGSRVLIQGALQTRKWSDQEGKDRYSTEVVLNGFGDKLIMLGDKGEGRAPAGIERGGSLAEELDEEIPFGPEHR
jgi:single-strand DNA-binding protein